MPMHIQELTANITVTDAATNDVVPPPPAAESTVPAPEELPPLETLVSDALNGPAIDEMLANTVVAPGAGAAGPTTLVDPAALYERVYRLMLDDLVIARERE